MTFKLLLLVLLIAVLTCANTEVVKYSVSDTIPSLPFPSPDPSWPALSQSHPDQKFNITPAPSASACSAVDEQCEHHLWTILDMTGPRWSSHSSYMLRVSWPAMFPTAFTIDVYSSPNNPNIKYARTYAVVDGVFTPPNDGTHPFLPHRTSSTPGHWDPVPFYLDLEPEYLGFLPESMIPVAVTIILISLFAYKFIVPPIDQYLQDLAEQARKEMASSNIQKRGLTRSA